MADVGPQSRGEHLARTALKASRMEDGPPPTQIGEHSSGMGAQGWAVHL